MGLQALAWIIMERKKGHKNCRRSITPARGREASNGELTAPREAGAVHLGVERAASGRGMLW